MKKNITLALAIFSIFISIFVLYVNPELNEIAKLADQLVLKTEVDTLKRGDVLGAVDRKQIKIDLTNYYNNPLCKKRSATAKMTLKKSVRKSFDSLRREAHIRNLVEGIPKDILCRIDTFIVLSEYLK